MWLPVNRAEIHMNLPIDHGKSGKIHVELMHKSSFYPLLIPFRASILHCSQFSSEIKTIRHKWTGQEAIISMVTTFNRKQSNFLLIRYRAYKRKYRKKSKQPNRNCNPSEEKLTIWHLPSLKPYFRYVPGIRN